MSNCYVDSRKMKYFFGSWSRRNKGGSQRGQVLGQVSLFLINATIVLRAPAAS